jgi:hypothetical protein
MAKRDRRRLGFRCGETCRGEQDANPTESESHEEAWNEQTGLRRGIFFHVGFLLLIEVEWSADCR